MRKENVDCISLHGPILYFSIHDARLTCLNSTIFIHENRGSKAKEIWILLLFWTLLNNSVKRYFASPNISILTLSFLSSFYSLSIAVSNLLLSLYLSLSLLTPNLADLV